MDLEIALGALAVFANQKASDRARDLGSDSIVDSVHTGFPMTEERMNMFRDLADISAAASLLWAFSTTTQKGAQISTGALITGLSVGILLRALCVYATILPNAEPAYAHRLLPLKSGNDKMFSGHTFVSAYCAQVIVRNGGSQGGCVALVGATSLGSVLSRGHYSIDVLVAWMAARLVFTQLH